MKEFTIYDIAASLGLSASTVSRALRNDPVINENTRHRVNAHAREIGYRSNAFARNLSNRRSQTIGVIVPRLDSVFISSCLAGMEEVAREKGYDLLITQSQELIEREEENSTLLFNKRVDGLLISLTRDIGDLSYFQRFKDKKVPVVFFDRVPPSPEFAGCVIGNEKMAFEATCHLIEQGCRRLVHLSMRSALDVYHDRAKGFQRAVAESRIAEGRVFYLDRMDLEHGRSSAEQIMDYYADGVFASNDRVATGCLLALQELGIRIPEDVAIVGFNNEEVCTIVNPHLSSVNYPGKAMGQKAMQVLLDAIDRNAFPGGQVEVPGSLIVRASSLRK